MARRVADAAGTVADVGPYGHRVGLPRLDPSLVAPLGGVANWSTPIPVGCAVFFFSTANPGTPHSVTVTFAGGTTLAISIGSNGFGFLRAADGFVSVGSASSQLSAFLVVDTGSPSSYVQGGDYNANAPTQFLGSPPNAPQTGIWTVSIKPTVAATYPTIAGNLVAPLGVTSEAAIENDTAYTFVYPVNGGTAYAVAGGTVEDGTIE